MLKWNLDSNELEFVDPCMCNAWVATAIIGTGLVSAGVQAYSAHQAANAQSNAATQAAATQMAMYNQTNANLSPFRQAGVDATTQLQGMLPDLTKGVSVNPQDFTNSDQYKFLQSQGERAVTNSSAARGLATSGAALKGASAFETGLNSTQWQQNFNNQVTNQTNAYNRLKGLIDTGENAAAQTGTAATATGTGVGQTQIASGNAQAAGINAAGTAAGNFASSVPSAFLVSGLYGKNANSGSSGLPIAPSPAVNNYNSGNPVY